MVTERGRSTWEQNDRKGKEWNSWEKRRPRPWQVLRNTGWQNPLSSLRQRVGEIPEERSNSGRGGDVKIDLQIHEDDVQIHLDRCKNGGGEDAQIDQ